MAAAQQQFGKPLSSHPAAIVWQELKQKMDAQNASWRWLAVSAAIAFAIPTVGVGIGWGINVVKSFVVEGRKKDVLAEHYKEQVAATLGIDPAKVTAKQLEQAAKINPMIASAIENVTHERNSELRASTFGAVGAYATGAAFAPLLGGVVSNAGAATATIAEKVVGNVAHVATTLPGDFAGTSIGALFDKDVLAVHDVMEHIDAKQHAGEAIAATDVLMLRIAQDEKLQKVIKQHHDIAFHKMNAAQQQAVIAALPGHVYAEAAESAMKVNQGQMQAQNLIMVSPASWTNRVGGRKDRPASFVAAHEARTAAAQALPNFP